MTKKQLRTILLSHFGPYLEEYGYKASIEYILTFHRILNDAHTSIWFGSYKKFRLTCSIGTSIESLHQLLLIGNDRPYTGFGLNIGFLTSHANWMEWRVASKLDAQTACSEIHDILGSRGIRLLEECSTLAGLRSQLCGTAVSFAMDRSQKEAAIIAIDFLLGKQGVALARLDEMIETAPEWPPKYRWPLNAIRANMVRLMHGSE